MKMSSPIKRKLQKELSNLQATLNIGHQFKLKYLPNQKRISKNGFPLMGEVNGDFIFIYVEDETTALETLRHEFIDYMVAEAIKPYQEICNVQRQILNGVFTHLEDNAYLEKEAMVDRLIRPLTLIDKNDSHDTLEIKDKKNTKRRKTNS